MKSHEGLPWSHAHASRSGVSTLATAIATLLLAPTLANAKETVSNLGGSLPEVAMAASGARDSSGRVGIASAAGQVDDLLQYDEIGRVLVRVSFNGKMPGTTVMANLQAMKGVAVVASDMNYSAGVVEAYVPTDMLLTIARAKGVLAVVPASQMITNVGLTDSQAVIQHRVNQVPDVDGTGITIGVLSDSYNTNGGRISAASDVASGDLPGTGNPLGNSMPVVVVQDSPAGTDEGRAMLQLVHDVAPKARLGFATANGGELGFANNIRALAGFPDAPNFVPGFKADIVVDDIIYLAEPFFQDGIVAQAVDQVARAGVSYFSSAGNQPATQAYDSKVRIVPATAASMAGTNLNFTNVNPALYAGGFHDFDEGSAVDIAQTINFNGGNRIVFQWNEPFDPQPPRPVGAPLASGVSTVPHNGNSTFTFTGTAGQTVEIFVDEDTTTTGTPIPDITLALIGPNNVQLQFLDTGTNPESLTLELPQSGTYTVVVDSFLPAQFGDYQYRVQQVQIIEQVLSDYNLLFFSANGTFLTASTEQNLFTNRPIELTTAPTGPVQMVVARANVPNSRNRNVADRIRYVGFRGVNPQEYFSYIGPVIYGHSAAQGAMGVAAYPFFAPFVPESFTTPGPTTIYFDENNRRLLIPRVRQKPDVAAMDGANNTFFGGDSAVDPDAFPNFFGTSAAAPHAAAIAALVLDAAGGPGKVTPNRMRKILQDSAFPHDLDPYFSSGFALSLGNLLTINAASDTAAIGQFDPNVFTVTQLGFKSLQTLSINGSGGNPTQTPGGIVFDPRSTPLPAPGQPFVVGRTVGLDVSDVVASYSVPADAPGLPNQWKQLDLTFANGAFRSGDRLSFGIDRDEADVAGPGGAVGGNSADLLGGGVLIPSGTFAPGGASFFGTFQGGLPFKGEFFNLIGNGYSPLDGYGFINAEAAVKAVAPRGVNRK